MSKFNYGGREGTRAVHVAVLLADSLFLCKGRVDVDMVSRLVQAGIRPDCAVETVAWFRQQGNDAGLERYVNEVEEKYGVCVLQPEPSGT